ncbi:hypothetical protein GCM10011491_08160 [Brucella endophytica]|uniref:Uncharacterized protein n=2 Tax=Brucella endophytica TaxID=1963359 RepID=A0A916S5Y9_9HYPH|nr:hypothetical protein GCM10011491_08160 [Brucella endophytica]
MKRKMMFAKAARLLAYFGALALCASIPSMAQDKAPSDGVLPAGPVAGDMDLSPFYRWAMPLPGEPGTLLREETLASQPGMGVAGETLRILYVSSDARWHSGNIPVSGMRL